MAAQSLHDIYTRQTIHLLHWPINTSNGVIQSREDGSFDMKVNTTGETTADEIPKMARLVAENVNTSEIPDLAIYLFDAVIQDRTTIHKAWVRLEKSAENPDLEVVESNKKHKYFIDKLFEAFTALDGPSRLSEQKASHAARPGQDDLNELARFTNRFSALSLNGDSRSDSGESGAESASRQASRLTLTKGRQKSKGQRRKAKKEKGKWRKGDSQKKKEKQLPQKDAAAEPCHNEVPLESCRIIGDVDIAYNMAVHAFTRKWIELRSEVQNAWINVVDKGLHSVVATGVTHLTVAMVKQSEAALAVGFPGRENYQTVMGTLTGGKPDICRVSLRVPGCNSGSGQAGTVVTLDVKEHVMIHTFRDLVDFLVDYANNTKGRPSLRTSNEIQSWDPRYDLQRVTPVQRLKWRRTYTLKWLYDLTDAYISTNQDQHPLFGLNEFAATIISLAKTTPATDIGNRVMPHHVFLLQCIIDSFTVSRGWFVSSRGHILSSVPYSFHPGRDIDRFMRGKNSLIGFERFTDTGNLKTLCGNNSAALGCARRLESMYVEFLNQQTMSRSPDGPYEVPPFAYGAGLLEVLDITYSIGLRLLENMPEVLLILHLHNMLVAKGFLEKPIEIYAMITRWMTPACFGDAGVPTSGFVEAFLACIDTLMARSNATDEQSSKGDATDTATDIHREDDCDTATEGQSSKRNAVETATDDVPHTLEPEANGYFQTHSFLNLCRRAGWIPDNIPGDELCPASRLMLISKCQLFWVRKKKAQGNQTPEPPGGYELPLRNMMALLMCDLSNDVEGNRPRANLNFAAVAAHSVSVFQTIEYDLYRMRDPLYITAYERRNPYGWEKRVAFTYLALLRQDEGCLGAVAAAFEQTRKDGGDFTYWAGKKSPPAREPYDPDLGRFLDAVCPIM